MLVINTETHCSYSFPSREVNNVIVKFEVMILCLE